MKYPVALPLSSDESNSLATLSHPIPSIWQLEMHNGQDNRLTADFIWTCLLKALDIVEKDWRNGKETAGALVIVGRHPKFFSNGESCETASVPLFDQELRT